MKYLVAVFLALAVGLCAPAQAADPINVGDIISFVRGPGTGSGGEFIVYKGGVPVYSTFCVQIAELLSLSPIDNPTRWLYKVGNISEQIVLAGSKPLDHKSAWLYTQFRAGTLPGYDGSDAAANALQNAIWHSEGLVALQPGNATMWYNMAVAAGWTDNGLVRVINLMYPDGYAHAQDVLVIVPIPEPLSMTLAGLGLAAVAGLRGRARRRT